MRSLTIRYLPAPDDEMGKLWFDLQADQFSGSAFFWSNLVELEAMISELEKFPLGTGARWAWGYDRAEGADAVLTLALEQVKAQGDLNCSVMIADLHDSQQRLQAAFPTDYASVEQLRLQLAEMRVKRFGSAVLQGF